MNEVVGKAQKNAFAHHTTLRSLHVIASEAKQSMPPQEKWIASSLRSSQ
jgi:hypothetical protein